MFGITVEQAAQICGGTLNRSCAGVEHAVLQRVVIDSRSAAEGDLFVAYRGEKTDGHRYIATALKQGAACALAEYVPAGVNGAVIVVSDVQKALEKLTAAFRSQLTIPFVGVTGSVGKTTAKEMTASVLAQHFCVLKSEGNKNNLIGVPMTLSCITPENELAVVEMGINHFGEMRRLAQMVRPDAAIFTNIGHAHLEYLGDLAGVRRAKTEMLEFMAPDGQLILNGDDLMLRTLECTQRKIYYGFGEGCDVRAVDCSHTADGCSSCTITYQERAIRVEIPVFGEHLIYAALAAAAAGFVFGLSDEEIRQGIQVYQPAGRRFAIVDTGFVRLIDDCYNSNPDSLGSSLRSLCSLHGKRVAILGDMLELGTDTEAMHRRMGQLARELGLDRLITCGPLAALISEGYGTENETDNVHFDTVEELQQALPGLLHNGEIVLVKASRGIELERVSEAIKRLPARPAES